jgi:hypothetical protein
VGCAGFACPRIDEERLEPLQWTACRGRGALVLGMNKRAQLRRRLYTHNQLLSAANDFAKQTKGDSEFNSAMASVLFCALALEAVLNHIGGSLVPSWEEHFGRRLSPEGKLTLIASQVTFPVDFGQRPFQAFRVLFEFRNQLAHGVTKDLAYENTKHWLKYGKHRWPAAKWEVLCNAEKAASLVADTEQMIEELFRASGTEAIPAFLISEHIAHAEQDATADLPAAPRPPGG